MNAKKTAGLNWLMAVVSAALLGACGGSGGDEPSDSGAAPQAEAPDRIEPYDTGDVVALGSTVALRSTGLSPDVARVALGPLEKADMPARSAALGAAEPQIGVARDVPGVATVARLSALWRWTETAGGKRVAALSVSAQGAKGVRLGVLVRQLPPGAVLRFYAQAREGVVEVTEREIAAAIERNVQAGTPDEAAHTYWSPDFGGAETTLEVEIPAAAATASVKLAVPQLSHYVLAPDQATPAATGLAKAGEAGSCEVDVMCRPEFLSQSRSVVRMLFVRGGNTFLCTGTLLNDKRSSLTPYLLTAEHCISSQEEASSLITDWFYRSSGCDTGTLGAGARRRFGGATLLHAAAATDTAFLRLHDAPPPGAVYAGSYFGPLEPGLPLATVHHPKGDLQKISTGQLLRFSICAGDTCQPSDASEGTYLTMRWNEGVTEGGSSGSALFRTLGARRYVVGQLYGGATSCLDPSGNDHYGRFDVAYRSALKQWLNP